MTAADIIGTPSVVTIVVAVITVLGGLAAAVISNNRREDRDKDGQWQQVWERITRVEDDGKQHDKWASGVEVRVANIERYLRRLGWGAEEND